MVICRRGVPLFSFMDSVASYQFYKNNMIVEVPAIWAFSALLLIMIIIAFYFAIFYMIFYIAGWGVTILLRVIGKFLSV